MCYKKEIKPAPSWNCIKDIVEVDWRLSEELKGHYKRETEILKGLEQHYTEERAALGFFK